MKKPSFLFALLFIAGLTAQAQGHYYFPDKVNSPGLQKAMEGKATLSFKPVVKLLDFPEHMFIINPAVDLAFSPADHFAITLAYRSIIRRPVADGSAIPGWYNSDVEYNGNRFELGAGYYTSFGNNGYFEAFAAYSYGNLRRSGGSYVPDYSTSLYLNNYSITFNSDFNASYSTYSAHIAAGVAKKHISFRGGMKLTVQDMSGFAYKDPAVDTLANNTETSARIKAMTYTFLQPYVDLEAGGNLLRFNFQAGVSQQMLDWVAFRGDVRAYISLGAVIRFGAKKG